MPRITVTCIFNNISSLIFNIEVVAGLIREQRQKRSRTRRPH